MTTPQLKLFTDLNIIRQVDRSILTQFLERLNTSLSPEAAALLAAQLDFEEHCAAWAAQFGSTSGFGAPLLQALVDIETLALPENQLLLENALSHLPPGYNVNRNRPALHQAIHLWLIANNTPGVTWPLPPSPFKVQGSVFNVQCSSAVENPAQSKIENSSPFPPFPPVQSPVEPEPAATFLRLAHLSPLEYDAIRKSEATRLHLRVRVLDSAVAKARAEIRAQDELKDFPDINPWPEPVNGAELLTEISALFARRLVLRPGAADAMALWVHLPHVLDAFHIVPRLSLYSLEPGCGKTSSLDIIALLVPRPLRTESVSHPVIYRLVDRRRVTLLLDELDTYLPRSDKHRGLLNAGHKRGARTYRCAAGGELIRGFNAFAAAVLASIGPLPSTLRDRSIAILMPKAEENQIAEPFDPGNKELEITLGRKLARWAQDNLEALKTFKPTLPPGVFNRLADNWRPLFAIAQLAGGDWPARVLAAFNHLTAPSSSSSAHQLLVAPKSDAGGSTINYQLLTDHQLLSDIRGLFAQSGAHRLFSSDIVDSLRALPDRPWSASSTIHHPSSNGDNPINESWLARHLRRFAIRSHTMRIGPDRAKGYDLADFTDAFALHLDKSP